MGHLGQQSWPGFNTGLFAFVMVMSAIFDYSIDLDLSNA